MEACCRCRDVKEFASRGLEMRRRRVASLLLELWRCAAGVDVWRCFARLGTWKCRGMEVWRLVAGVSMWNCRGMELRSSGGALQACTRGRVGYGGIEVWRCAAGVLPLFASRAPEL